MTAQELTDAFIDNIKALPFEAITIATPEGPRATMGLVLGDWALNENSAGWAITHRKSGYAGQSFPTPIEALISLGIYLGSGLRLPDNLTLDTFSSIPDIRSTVTRIESAITVLDSWTSTTTTLQRADMLELRLQIAEARATLRAAKDSYELARAQAEQHAIDSGTTGRNAEERARNLTLALAADVGYQRTLAWLRGCEAEVERLDAILEGARDARRVEEWQIRARLAEGLLRAGVQSDSGEPTRDVAFDDAIGQQLDRATYARLADDVEVPTATPRTIQSRGQDRNGRVIDTTEWYGR